LIGVARAVTSAILAAARRLLMGLEALVELGRKGIRMQSDSQLLVRQLNGEYRVKNEKLKILYLRAQALLHQFDSYRIVQVYREMSKVADRLANRGIDDAMGRNSTG